MSDEEIIDSEPPTIDPYEVLGLGRDATPDQVKSAYRKAALKSHPDKVPAEQRDEANRAFQGVAFAYAILSDPARRKRYDATGSTSESIVDSDGFDWSEYYRAQFADAVSADAIAAFAARYKASEEERDDVLAAYEEAQGDMDAVYENVMLSNVLEDDDRFRRIIDEGIANGHVQAHARYKKESGKKREARAKAARAEADEAEEMAKELGVHDKLFGERKSKETGGKTSKARGKKEKGGSEDALKALIQQRSQNSLDSLIENLEAKYGGGSKKGKKRPAEPTEEEFQAAASKVKKKKTREEPNGGKPAKRARR